MQTNANIFSKYLYVLQDDSLVAAYGKWRLKLLHSKQFRSKCTALDDRYFSQRRIATRGYKIIPPSVLLDRHLLAIGLMKSSLILSLITLVLLLISVPAAASGVGEVAPNFEISTQDGGTFRLSDYRGQKPVYAVFWNTWCPYCIKKTPRYQKLQEQFGDKIEIIAINTTWSDSPEEMRSFEEDYQIKYSTAFDAGESVTDQYRVLKVPTEFIVDINGIIRFRDSVPEYVATHLPDWLLPYISPKDTAQLVCKK